MCFAIQKTKRNNDLQDIFFLNSQSYWKKYNAVKSLFIFVPTGFL